MLISITVMGVLAAALSIMAYQKGGGAHITGFKSAGNLFIQVIPLLIFAFIVAGMIQVLIPKELISKWIGIESGVRGVLIGTVLGGFYSWWANGQPSYCRWIPACRGKHRNDGSLFDRLVSVSHNQIATGNWSHGLEIHRYAPCPHFLLSTPCRTDG